MGVGTTTVDSSDALTIAGDILLPEHNTTFGNSGVYYNGETFLGVVGVATYTESGTSTVHVTVDLPVHTHDEIVKMAANMALENIEQPRYQTHMVEVGTME